MTADEAPAERLHPFALLSGLGQAARNLFGAIAAGGYFAFQGQFTTAILMLGGLGVLIIGGLLLGWWRFSFRVGSDAVRIDSGIVSRNHRTIPFDRVHDVSIEQGPVQRLVGLAKVTLETGASVAGKEEGVLAGIPLARAETLREHVRSRRGAPTLAVAEAGEAPEQAPLFAMDTRRVLTLGLFNFSLALFAGLFGASQTLGDLFEIDPFERQFWRPFLADGALGAWLLDHQIGLAIGGVVVLVVVGIVTGVVRTALREWGLRLTRTGSGLRRRRGLLTKTDVSLPLRRIQAGVIATGPVRDHWGWRAFKVQSLASDAAAGKNASDHVLVPLGTDEELSVVAAELGWPMPGPAIEWRPVSRAHVTIFCLLCLPVFPLLLVLAPLRWLEWRRTAWVVDGERLWLRTGWWKRETLLLPLGNVQSVSLQETSLARKFGVATLAIGTAGGPMMGHRIPALPKEEASLLREQLLSRQP